MVYDTCMMFDGPTEVLYVALGGFRVRTRAFTTFAPESRCETPDWATALPPEGLDSLSEALAGLMSEPGEP